MSKLGLVFGQDMHHTPEKSAISFVFHDPNHDSVNSSERTQRIQISIKFVNNRKYQQISKLWFEA